MGVKRTKTCSKCKKEQPTSNFYKRKEVKDGLVSNCKQCQKETKKKYYKDNKEKIIAHNKQWRLDNLDKMKEADRVRHSSPEYKEKKRESSAKWRDSDKGKAYNRNYFQKHFQENKEYYYNKTQVYRTRKKVNTPVLSNLEKSMIEALYFCSRVLSNSCSEIFHVDHIQPISKGGSHTFDNLQILTARENLQKGAKYVS